MGAGAAAEAGAGGAAAGAAEAGAIDTSVGASLATEGGASGYAAGGASEFGAPGAASGAAAGTGFMTNLTNFFKDPNNLKMIGNLMKAGGSIQDMMNKAPDKTKQDFQQITKSVQALQAQAQSSQSGAPSIGSISPTGSYTGDITSYAVNPQMARIVLANMGIPYGKG